MKHIFCTFHLISIIFFLSIFPQAIWGQEFEKHIDQAIQYKLMPEAQKISPDLLILGDEYRSHMEKGTGAFHPTSSIPVLKNEMVRIEAVCLEKENSFTVDRLKSLGLTDVSAFQRVVNGWLPITKIRELDEIEGLAFVHLAYRPIIRTGSVTSQGDTAQRSHIARMNSGLNGMGVTVGVLSDSYDDLGGAATDISTGDLPLGGVNNLDNGPGGGSDEGRAMLQIIHDVAPGADLAFHTAFGGLAVFASGILDLEAAGCNTIVDDIGYPNDAFFQDGIVAQAADSVTAVNDVYLSAAGNDADQSYQGTFTQASSTIMIGPATYTPHDFDTGPGMDIMQCIVIPDDGFITLSLQWENPFFSISGPPGASTDLDLFLYDGAGSTVVASSTINNFGGDAFEIIQFQNTTGAPANFNILIGHFSGPFPNTIKWIILGDLDMVKDFPTNSATCFAHPNAAGALGVGAAAYFNTPEFGVNPPVLNGFSSRGGTPILFDTNGNSITPVVRMKPDFTAPDGGDNTFFGSDINDPGTFPNFFGTSAAAPHAAGVVALMQEANAVVCTPVARMLLQNSAVDIPPAGFDMDSGAGLIRADSAISSLLLLLPLELTRFDARAEDNDAFLEWETGSELNNLGFEVELAADRGSTASELIWENKGFVPGQGTTILPHFYEFMIPNLSTGTYYLRLKQIDLDGANSYSIIRSIQIREDGSNPVIISNPQSSEIQIRITSEVNPGYTFTLFDELGRVLIQSDLAPFAGNLITFDTSALSTGIYIYSLRSYTETFSGKILLY